MILIFKSLLWRCVKTQVFDTAPNLLPDGEGAVRMVQMVGA